PEYMIPAYFIKVDSIPLTANGKIDRAKLPEPDGNIYTGMEYIAPRTETEIKLASVWEALLGVNKPGIYDNFFDLGGHSLKAALLVSRIYREFDAEIPLKDIFVYPTIAGLAGLIENTAKSLYQSIEPAAKMDYYPVSSAQKRLYVLSRLEPDSTNYNMTGVMEIKGRLDIERLKDSFSRIVKKHESLRTCFKSVDGEVFQFINKDIEPDLDYYDLQLMDRASADDRIKSFIRPFELDKAPLIRMGLIRTDIERHILIFDMHHIISDGVSMDILTKDIAAAYEGVELGRLRIQYKDFALWQRELLSSEAMQKQKNYWLDNFRGEIPVLEMPLDFPRPVIQSFEGSTVNFELEEAVTDRLNTLALKNGATLFMVLMAAYNVLLSKYTGHEDIVVGTTVAGRNHPDIEDVVGMFVNTLPLRNHPVKSKTFIEFLNEVKNNTLRSIQNQDYQFEQLVEDLNLRRDMSRNPLFDTMFTLQNTENADGELKGLDIGLYDFKSETSIFDITLDAEQTGGKIVFTLEYCTKLFKEDTMLRFGAHFIKLLKQISENPLNKLSEIEMLSQIEKDEILYKFNGKNIPYNLDIPLHSIYEELSEKNPDKTAVKYLDSLVTYKELNQRANRIARYLNKNGVNNGDLVCVLLERSIGMIEVIIGIWKLGGAYIPMDVSYPLERKLGILKDSGTKTVVTMSGFLEEGLKDRFDGKIICLDQVFDRINEEDSSNLNYTVDTDNLAYVLFTSGSTGNPKGVMIEHKGMLNHILAQKDELNLDEDMIFAQNANHCFDVSVWQMFGALALGGTTVVYPNELVLEVGRFTESVKRDGITLLEVVPSYLNVMLDYIEEKHVRLDALKHLLITGEAARPDIVRRWFELCPGIKMVNAYGPAEASDDVTGYIMDKMPEEAHSISIGRPIGNMNIYITDENLNLCPVGVVGEICVSGIGVGRGYINNPDKTSEVFMSDPYRDDEVRLYRTGDLGRWLPDGNIEFYGRKDYQVKVRGYRIELGEIENRLSGYEDIKDSAVIDLEDEKGSKYLCAYYVSDIKISGTQLKEYMQGYLPQYMVPAYFMQLESMPYLPSGKIDRKALPKPEGREGADYAAPENDREQRLASIWEDVLKVTGIGVQDNFFDLGGHSLKATVLVSRIHKEFGVEVPLSEVFKHPTVRELSEYLSTFEQKVFTAIRPIAEKREFYEVSSAQKRLYILDMLDKNSTGYNMSSVVSIEGSLDIERMKLALNRLTQRHEALRTSFRLVEGEPVQVIAEEILFEMDYEDISAELNVDIDRKISEFIKPFDLGKAPLMRAALIKVEEDRHLMLFDMHHIISDGASSDIIIDEFTSLYMGKEPARLNIQYKDFAAWQNELFKSESILRQQEYWREVFRGEIPVLNLPLDFQRPSMQSFEGGTTSILTSEDTLNGLNNIARGQGATLYMVLLAAYNLLLSKYTGQQDIVVGSPVAGRNHAELQNAVGMFVNTLALRNYPEKGKTFTEFLSEVKANTLKAFENQDYQFEALVDGLNIRRDMSRNPLFDTMFALQNTENMEVEIEGLTIRDYEYENKASIFDISVDAQEIEGRLNFEFEYCTKLFREETIRRFAEHFVNILDALVKNPEIKPEEIDMLCEEEIREILDKSKGRPAAYELDKTLPVLFEENVLKNPGKTAVIFEDTKITYKDLNRRANRIARYLKLLGMEREDLAGVILERTPLVVESVLGIWKAQGAYIPLDVNYPNERKLTILEDSRAKVVLTLSRFVDEEFRACFKGKVVCLDLIDGELEKLDEENNELYTDKHGLAYVLFTSGSTGKPKGVMIEHAGMLNHIFAQRDELNLNENMVFAQNANHCFDISVWQFFGPLALGGTTAIYSNELVLEVGRFTKRVARDGVTLLEVVPSYLAVMLDYIEEKGIKLNTLEHLMITGEAARPAVLRRWFEICPQIRVVNAYGPAEASDDITQYVMDRMPENSNTISIGRPLNNIRVYITDDSLNLCPVGVVGEICVAGIAVGRGYINNPEKTFEVFRKDPYQEGDERLYMTGDLGRWLADGNIEFLGRKDYQVKVRGYRIELGEIESKLSEFGEIRDCAVIDLEDESANKYICAYYTADRQIEDSELKEHLQKYLPQYMLPAYFVKLDQMPYLPSGKIDRKSLPEPCGRSLAVYAAPENETEEILVSIWQEVLNTGKVSIDDNFFDLGGHSLKAAVMTAKIHRDLNVEVPLASIFDYPTVRQLSSHISALNKSAYEAIPVISEKREYYPVSSAQKRLYVLHRMDESSTGYNMSDVVAIEGEIDLERIRQALAKLCERHEALRTSFRVVEGEPVQILEDACNISMEYEKIPEADENGIEERINKFIRPFDLGKAPLMRTTLLKLNERKHIMLFDMHHIICDGASMDIFIDEFTKLYKGEELIPLTVQYKDFAVWQNDFFRSDRIKQQEEYWLSVFKDEIPVLDMPTDFRRPAIQSFDGSSVSFEADGRLLESLNNLALSTGTTLYMVLMAAYNVLLSKYSRQEDIIVGSPVAGRNHAELQNVLGMFVNTLAIRNRPQKDKSFAEFLEEVKSNTLKAFENQDYQFEELVDNLKIRRDISRNPLFDTMFAMQNTENIDIEIQNLNFKAYNFETKSTMFDLSLDAEEIDGKLVLSLEYSSRLFKKETMERFIIHFLNILKAVSDKPDIRLKDIELIDYKDKEYILKEFSCLKSGPVSSNNWTDFIDLFENQVKAVPAKTALKYGDRELSYAELNCRVDSLAARLKEFGVSAERTVAIMVEKSFEMIIGLFGILKSDGAYLPIDPNYPKDRIKYILEDSKAEILLTLKQFSESVEFNGQIICLDDDGIYSKVNSPVRNISRPSDLAYIIYTSGSTGKPKGVMVERCNMNAYIHAFLSEFKLRSEDVVIQQASFCFDAFVEEVYPIMSVGGTLVIPTREQVLDISMLAEIIEKNNVKLISCSPLMLNELNRMQPLRSIHTFISGGDVLKEEYITNLKEYASVYNTYGPTEGTVCATYYKYTGEHGSNVPIGKPVKNYRVYVLDENGKVLPAGVPGELCIAGCGVARGYLGKEELTGEKFVEDPFVKGERMYKSGDLVKWLDDGNIEFLGRIDSQVKVRGYRIELGEIEKRLAEYDSVSEAVVLAIDPGDGEKYLCAYYVSENEITVQEFNEFLLKELPEYMVPAYFIRIDRIPVTSNGKIDAGSLPKPEGKINTGAMYVAPRNEAERKIAAIWADLLKLDIVGIDDNFFNLGGHSLKATVMVSKIHQDFGVQVPLSEVFVHPTIRGLGEYLSTKAENTYMAIEPITHKRDYYEASSAQKRQYILDMLDENNVGYNISSVISIEGSLDVERLKDAFRKLGQRHEALRTSFGNIDGRTVQVISENIEFEIAYEELIDATDKEIEIKAVDFIQPFDLSTAPLMRVGLVKVNENKHIMLLDMHHIISDGESVNIIIDEFTALYNGMELPELRIQYKDFAAWQNELFMSEKMKEHEEYWLETFKGELPVLNLPLDFPRPSVQSFDGNTIHFECSEDLLSKLKSIALEQGATLYMVLVAAYNVLLSKYSGQEDIIVGTPVAGRNHAELQNVIGMFVNTIALRNYPVRTKTFIEFLDEVKANTLKAFENQDYQFEELIDRLDLIRDMSRNPLFDTMFALQNTDSLEVSIRNLVFSEVEFENRTSKFDIAIEISEENNRLYFDLEYCTRLFRKDTMQRFAGHFVNLLQLLANNPKMKLCDAVILSEDEKDQLLSEFNDYRLEYPEDKTIQRIFEEQVQKTPQNIAIVYKDTQLTYEELNKKANLLAAVLIDMGVEKETIVGIMVNQSAEMLVGILGILKAGGAYLPIDPSYPEERINFMLDDSGSGILITQSHLKYPDNYKGQVIKLDEQRLYTGRVDNPDITGMSSDLAYVIYTSGSTGRPKGVMVEHKSLVNLCWWHKHYYGVTENDRATKYA
ncbi:MAG: amino acid adenylation domain-containing protein, partial [Clostridiaceae bacterium]|nr:amino acid adenylation domain-containing protein [Clostridiaceae bacterium]